MSAVWMRAISDLRLRLRATIVLILLVGLAAGVVISAAAGARRTQTAYPRFLQTPHAADALIARIRATPLVLAGLLALLGLAMIAHALATSVRRRRHDIAILKTLGFVRRQVSATVAWQATTFAAVALVIGIPLGVGAGRWVWSLFVEQLGVPPEPAVNLPTILVAIPITLLVANLVAALPGRIASRMQPAQVLRTE